jgi:translation initiation factor IF-3
LIQHTFVCVLAEACLGFRFFVFGGTPISVDLRVNRRIKIKEVRLISSTGEQLGILPTFDALKKAEEEGLDLVEVSPDSRPPVCKIMDYGKYRYESEKREREAKKKQHVVVTKEIKVRPKIDPHDFGTKFNHVKEFLAAGYKVRCTVMFRGREMAHQEAGYGLLDRMVKELGDTVIMEQYPKMEGMNLSLLVAPRPAGSKPKPPSTSSGQAPAAVQQAAPAQAPKVS